MNRGPMSGKTSGLRIRVEPELHQDFINICKKQDKIASQVVRDFMKAYVSRHTTARPNKGASKGVIHGHQ